MGHARRRLQPALSNEIASKHIDSAAQRAAQAKAFACGGQLSRAPQSSFREPLLTIYYRVAISMPKTCRSSMPLISVEHSPNQPFS